MPRNRMIKPEFWESETLSSVSRDARLLFIGIWNFADDYGFAQTNNRRILGDIFPYDEDVTIAKIQKWIKELLSSGVIVSVEYDGKSLFYIKSWLEHQVINRPSKRRYVKEYDYERVIKDSCNTHATLSEYSVSHHGDTIDQRERERERERESKRERERQREGMFERFWTQYPKKAGKAEAKKAFMKAAEKEEPEAIILAVKNQKQNNWKGTEDRFIPMASSWLNQERWEDEITRPKAQANDYSEQAMAQKEIW